jgi:SRSO17 transposase
MTDEQAGAVLVRDLLADLVSAVVDADAELMTSDERFVIPRARVGVEFVVTVDKRKQSGFLLWAKLTGSQYQARASVDLELVATPPAT